MKYLLIFILFLAGSVQADSVKFKRSFNVDADKKNQKDVTTYFDALKIIQRLRGVNFTWKDTEMDDIGFVAQEVEEVEPDLVVVDPETGDLGVKYSHMTAILVEAVKDQDDSIKNLKTSNSSLKSKLSGLSNQMSDLQEENQEPKKTLLELSSKVKKLENK
jgi:peptidoglycan hydrolase CwlO-like protein